MSQQNNNTVEDSGQFLHKSIMMMLLLTMVLGIMMGFIIGYATAIQVEMDARAEAQTHQTIGSPDKF